MGIPEFIKTVCVQTAVYWSNPVADGYGGFTFGTPVEIPCRWDETTALVMDARGQEIVSRATILVTQDLEVDGVLWLGFLRDLTATQRGNPKSVEGAYVIKRIDKTPLFKSTTEFVRKVYL